MADKINDGGSAFPQRAYGQPDQSPGMSLRDWFAGMAMQAIVAHTELNDPDTGNLNGTSVPSLVMFAEFAYLQADAMLKAREAANGDH